MFVGSSIRLTMSGKHLKRELLAGRKWATTRNWKESTLLTYHRASVTGELVRVQSNWGHWTIFCWAKILGVSKRGHPNDVVDAHALQEAGCGHMSKEQYILSYCSILLEKNTGKKVPCKFVATIYFAALWTHDGLAIERSIGSSS